MNVKLKRLLLPLLRAAAKGTPMSFRMKSAASQALFLIGKATPKSKGGRLRREQKRATKKEETAEIREKVFRRAVGLCEVPGCHDYARVMDHWLGGNGRRREKQSFETCWALCSSHDRLRTANNPSAEHWNEVFAAHCRVHGYEPTPHITHAQLKRSAP